MKDVGVDEDRLQYLDILAAPESFLASVPLYLAAMAQEQVGNSENEVLLLTT